MVPADLKAENFSGYPVQARKLLVDHLAILQQLPLSFVPSLLREVIDYDYKFPAERAGIDSELTTLSRLSPPQRQDWFQAFAHFSLSPHLEQLDWIAQPAVFVEQLSAYLWTTHQQDAFRAAATAYGNRLQNGAPPDVLPVARLGIAVIGQGVSSYNGQLFRNLRAQGTYFNRVQPQNGMQMILSAMAARAHADPRPYGHWYVDGGRLEEHAPALTCVSYGGLASVRAALLSSIQIEVKRAGMGPEELRTHLARLSPFDLGMDEAGDPVLDRFQVRLLTEGSGTQIFSTTFAQWAAREGLRRAQPLTMLVRFAPRQRQRPMNELLSNDSSVPELDYGGSLIDGDMAAYYQWINQQRLPASSESSFLVWFEGHEQAIAVGPTMPRKTESKSNLDLGQLISLLTT